ncbi:MAG: helix-turn-helix transcriptional regulator [Butyrivibrio sp.]|jgi:transcriptional regulator with XRE-family HTH domain|uniref:helix-turn-helix domain-containing protein n=1 Tax=Butyrivibrio sp. TaxID=28121 RepID=UPI001ED19CCE|nr:helix-turn-helix transcriptional regulator [Butyrivibrio sp.]MBE5842268.1 helix-turn-helix transcriptional regulator [Butyrivibrio sp.]
MGEYLPGNLQERLRELRERNGFSSRNKLADELGIDRTTYSRIEKGTTKTISSDILVKLSKLYNVPTDFILGLSNVPENTAYDIAELGLSVEAAKNLYSKKIDSRVINELLLNENFAVATRMMALYFSHAVTKLIQSQNVLLDNSMNVLDELIKTGAIHGDRSAADLKKGLIAAKLPKESYEIDRIQKRLTAAVRDIKKKMVNEVASADSEKLEYEIMERVKQEAAASPSLNNLDEKEKVKVIKNTIMQGILVYADVDDKKMALIDPLVEQIALLLIELWKES